MDTNVESNKGLSIVKIIAAILFISLPFLGFYIGINYEKSTTYSDINEVNISLKPAAQTIPTPDTNETEGWKTYTNKMYGYQLQYPSEWILKDEESYSYQKNNILILSKVSVSDKNHKFFVWIDTSQPPLVFSADTRVSTTVSGVSATAYIFPEGYECYDQTNKNLCSVFEIPIKRNKYWFRLGGVGNVDKNLNNVYKQILSTFRFD